MIVIIITIITIVNIPIPLITIIRIFLPRPFSFFSFLSLLSSRGSWPPSLRPSFRSWSYFHPSDHDCGDLDDDLDPNDDHIGEKWSRKFPLWPLFAPFSLSFSWAVDLPGWILGGFSWVVDLREEAADATFSPCLVWKFNHLLYISFSWSFSFNCMFNGLLYSSKIMWKFTVSRLHHQKSQIEKVRCKFDFFIFWWY